jgi:alkanesulfonate monooxygenase SsuD/methylene tetrahydromethanopterin reductase-like flavin-dependent oxidoreductase (luciferase family)
MFGIQMGDRKARYRLAAEWTMLVKRLWTETEQFDYDGEFFSLKGAISAPKPVQSPRPLLMNAGQSEEGLDFAVNNVDMVFVSLLGEEVLKANIATVKGKAANLGKPVSVWANIDVICKSTEQEARDFADAWMEAADDVAVDRFLGLMAGGDAGTHKDLVVNPEIRNALVLGGGGPTVVGTPEMLVEEFQRLSDLGMDGLTLTWHQYPEGLDQFVSDVMPLMREAGLRAT